MTAVASLLLLFRTLHSSPLTTLIYCLCILRVLLLSRRHCVHRGARIACSVGARSLHHLRNVQ